MKLPVYFLIIFFFILKNIFAQDLNAKVNGNSINCGISKITSYNVTSKLIRNDESAESYLFNDQIGHYKKGNIRKIIVANTNECDPDKSDFKKVRLGIQGGFSYLIAPVSKAVPDNLVQFTKDLKSGYHIGVDLGLFPFKRFGFGGKYINFRTKNENTNLQLKEDITIQYIGPVIINRFCSSNDKNVLITNVSAGYIIYEDYVENSNDNVLYTSNTFGLNFGLGYDTMIDKNIALGIGVGLTLASLSKFESTSNGILQVTKVSSNISRFDASIGLRIYL
jgi:hypothetical protein